MGGGDQTCDEDVARFHRGRGAADGKSWKNGRGRHDTREPATESGEEKENHCLTRGREKEKCSEWKREREKERRRSEGGEATSLDVSMANKRGGRTEVSSHPLPSLIRTRSLLFPLFSRNSRVTLSQEKTGKR